MRAMVLVAVALAWLSVPAAAQQSELGGKVRAGREVTVPAGETVPGDLVASAATVRVDGRVDGDLVASGGQVIVAGTVGGDVLVGVVLGLAGLGSLTGVAVVGGLLVAAMLVFLLVLAVGFAAPATVGLALGRLLVRDQGRGSAGGSAPWPSACWWWCWWRRSRWPEASWRHWWCCWGWARYC